MKITLGYSPCPNDTYMFAALANGWIDTQGLEFEIVLADVETLNEWAALQKLDISKISFNRALSLEDKYQLLSSGAALGNGCGPLLIAKSLLDTDALKEGLIALPGQWTTAHLLFSIFYPEVTSKKFIPFSDIEEAVLRGDALAGVIIHENRFTYEAKGLVKLVDLGEAWENLTQLPIPLGAIFASNQLPKDLVFKVESLIKESIVYAREHTSRVMFYVREHAQEMDENVMKQHIDLYVNDFSLQLGETGLAAVKMLKKMKP